MAMGAWGAGNFENDAALDWVWDLRESTGLGMIENAIADVLNCGDYLDADVGCIGLAAAEVVAALRNKPVDGLPEEVSGWVQAHGLPPSDALVKDCLAAVAKIKDDNISELRELWENGKDSPTKWYSALNDLASRLR
jgi:hypothetical protein